MSGTSAKSVRDAVASGDYQLAIKMWEQYAAAIAAVKPTRESLAEAAELIEWARPLLDAARSDAGERLRALHVAGVYGNRGASRRQPHVRTSF